MERVDRPGRASAQALVRFDDEVPDAADKQVQNERGFRFDPNLRAWAAAKSGGAVRVAKRPANEIETMRGVESGVAFYL